MPYSWVRTRRLLLKLYKYIFIDIFEYIKVNKWKYSIFVREILNRMTDTQMDRQIDDRQTDRRTYRHIDRQTDRQMYIQIYRLTDGRTYIYSLLYKCYSPIISTICGPKNLNSWTDRLQSDTLKQTTDRQSIYVSMQIYLYIHIHGCHALNYLYAFKQR